MRASFANGKVLFLARTGDFASLVARYAKRDWLHPEDLTDSSKRIVFLRLAISGGGEQ